MNLQIKGVPASLSSVWMECARRRVSPLLACSLQIVLITARPAPIRLILYLHNNVFGIHLKMLLSILYFLTLFKMQQIWNHFYFFQMPE